VWPQPTEAPPRREASIGDCVPALRSLTDDPRLFYLHFSGPSTTPLRSPRHCGPPWMPPTASLPSRDSSDGDRLHFHRTAVRALAHGSADTVIGIVLPRPPPQTRLRNPEILRHLFERGLPRPGHVDHVSAELLWICLRNRRTSFQQRSLTATDQVTTRPSADPLVVHGDKATPETGLDSVDIKLSLLLVVRRSGLPVVGKPIDRRVGGRQSELTLVQPSGRCVPLRAGS
jgi:hypothetical protein